MRRLVDEVEADATERERVAPVRRSALLVGAADDPAEARADAVADRVVSRLATLAPPSEAAADVHRSADPGGTGAIGAAGGALDAGAAGEIEAARGGGSPLPEGVRSRMEAGFGGSLGAVRVHTDARAARLSRAMSARAFTAGRDIFFGHGQYAPHTPDGERVLAHELAHTRQDGASAHRAMADAPVRRKMAGVAAALESQGGGETSGGFRKFFGRKTNWDKIVDEVRKYEREERAVTATPLLFDRTKGKLLNILASIRKHIADWYQANPDRVEDHRRGTQEDFEVFQAARTGAPVLDAEGLRPNVDYDARTKSGRRQAVFQLDLLASDEARMLSHDGGREWLATPTLTSGFEGSTGHETGVTHGGQVNTLHQGVYTKPDGTQMTGLFKADQGINLKTQEHEQQVGINNIDPAYAARAKALYRLDQLFDAGVTAKVYSAVRRDPNGQTKMGTVIEQVNGVQGGDVAFARDENHAQQLRTDDPGNHDVISLDDPVLQRGLNKLQLLDAIAGQLDRHQGNYIVERDGTGQVTGVKGIDLDMAFGSQMTSPHKGGPDAPQGSAPHEAHNYRGLPPEIDEQMGERILAVKGSDIREALTGLLPDAEVAATVARFTEVRRVVEQAKKEGRLRNNWGQQSNQPHNTWAESHGRETSSYQEDARNIARAQLEKRLGTRIKTDLSRRLGEFDATSDWKQLPESFAKDLLAGIISVNTYQANFFIENNPGVLLPEAARWTTMLRTAIYEQNFTSAHIDVVAGRVVDALIYYMQVYLHGFTDRIEIQRLKEEEETALTKKEAARQVVTKPILKAIQDFMAGELPGILR